MGAVGFLWYSRLRRRRRSWLVVVLLLGLGAGTGLACVAGARRTASSFGRIAGAAHAADITTSHGIEPATAVAIVNRFTGVARHSTQVGFVGFVEGVDPTLIKYFVGAWDEPLAPLLRAGRFPRPDRVEEVLVTGIGAEKASIRPGDALTVRLFGGEDGEPVARPLVVTGIAAEPNEVAADAAYDRSAIYFTPAFTHANADLRAWSATRLTAAPGFDVDQIVPQVLAQGWSTDEVFGTVRSRVQDAIRPLTATLGLLGALALLSTLVVMGQAMARHTDADRDDATALRGMGLSASSSRRLDVLTHLSLALPGSLLAVAVALALSPLFPVGSARRLEPDRGVAADLSVLALGSLGVVAALLLIGWAGTRRPARPARGAAPYRLRWLGAVPPSVAAGVRLAAGGTDADRRRFRSTVAYSTAALGLVVAGVAFVGALDRLSDEPVRYGAGWDLTARNAYGDVPPDQVRELVAGDVDIEAVGGAGLTSVLIDDEEVVPALAVLPVTTELWPTVVVGRTPQNDGEVIVGRAVLQSLDADIGDTVRLTAPYGGAAGPGPTVTIVGSAVFPSVELAGVDPTRLDTGLAMTWGRYQSLLDKSDEFDRLPDFTLVRLAAGADPVPVAARYASLPEVSGNDFPTEWLLTLAPAEVLETSRATGLMWAVIGLLGFTVVATIGNAVSSTVRRRRTDYAVLKALGFQRRQILGTVGTQSAAPVVVAIVLGLPLGVALGRWTWRLFARLIGVVDAPLVPIVPLVGIVVAAMVATVIVAARPGLRAARVPAAALYHE